jgi:hypothetical protein
LHHTGSQEVTPVAVPEKPEEQPKEQEVPETDEKVGEDLLECPDHRPSSFERGKPWSISLPRFANILLMLYFNCCIKFRSCLQPLLYYTLFTPFYHILVTLSFAVKNLLSLLRPVEVR